VVANEAASWYQTGMGNKVRIPLHKPTGKLVSAFDSLTADGLAPGPETVLSAQPVTKRGRVVLRRETAHRGGKAVVIAYDFESQVTIREIEELARQLKKSCGCGGTVKGREIEIQGDQPGKVCAILQAAGFRVAGVTK
jgi:translation initiation factor 1